MPGGEWQQTLLDQIVEHLRFQPHVAEVWVVGSVASSAHLDPWSDLDIGIVAPDHAIDWLLEVRAWLSQFGKIWVVRRKPNGRWAHAIFGDGRWVDVVVAPTAEALRVAGRRVFPAPEVEMDGPDLWDFTDSSPGDLVDDVLFCAALALKKVARNDLLGGMGLALTLARQCLELGEFLRDRDVDGVYHRYGGVHNDIAAEIGHQAPGVTAAEIARYVGEQVRRYGQLRAELDPQERIPDLALIDELVDRVAQGEGSGTPT